MAAGGYRYPPNAYEMEKREAAEGVVRCSNCPWKHSGKLLEGARLHREHRRSAHNLTDTRASKRNWRSGARVPPPERIEKCMDALRDAGGAATSKEIGDAVGLSAASVGHALSFASRAGKGVTKNGTVYVLDGTEPPVSGTERVRRLLEERGPLSTPELAEALGLTLATVVASAVHAGAKRVGGKKGAAVWGLQAS